MRLSRKAEILYASITTNLHSGIVSKGGQTEYRLRQRVARILVCVYVNASSVTLTLSTEWYTKAKNRGYLSTTILQSLRDVPFVEDRWHMLAKQLSAYRGQDFAKQSK
jgi:hypothetical protein